MKPCTCGGEVSPDYFDPIKRPVEWFMRCQTCGMIGAISSTRAGTIQLWTDASNAKNSATSSVTKANEQPQDGYANSA